jgi:recombination protein RecA
MAKQAVLPTGSQALNQALGVGGYPYGRITELFGVDSSGKTTLAFYAIAELQRRGGQAAFLDSERAFNEEHAADCGVDVSRLKVVQTIETAEAIDALWDPLNDETISLIVVDSGDLGDRRRFSLNELRKVCGRVHSREVVVIFVNQLRQRVGVEFSFPPPLQHLKFFASVRIDVRRIEGRQIRARIVKNKCAPPFTEVLIAPSKRSKVEVSA